MNDENNNLAPIVLFVYNRPDHTRQTVEALQKNELSSASELFIYSDAPKNEDATAKVNEVREYIKTIDGFKKVTIVERDKNWGLANSIIDGVTKIVNDYGKIIVLEDDLVTSPYFLKFMNEALEYYKDEKKVWHVSGWNYPIETEGLGDAFFWRVMNCWGWATWADSWAYFEKTPQDLIDNFSAQQKHHFDLDGSGVFWHQVTANAKGKMNTWAIFWYATLYEKGGLCLNPSQSYVDNIGHDGSGVHCGNAQTLTSTRLALCKKTKLSWPADIAESTQAVDAIKLYYKKQKRPFIIRVVNKLARITIGKNIFQ